MHIHSMFLCRSFLVKGLPFLAVIYMYTYNVKVLLFSKSNGMNEIDHTAFDKTLSMDWEQYLLVSNLHDRQMSLL